MISVAQATVVFLPVATAVFLLQFLPLVSEVNHVLNMILDHQWSKDWRGVCERCVPGRKVFHPAAPEEADVESAGERPVASDAADTTG